MTKKELTIIFMDAKSNKTDVGIEVTIPGQKDTEFIINKFQLYVHSKNTGK